MKLCWTFRKATVFQTPDGLHFIQIIIFCLAFSKMTLQEVLQ